MCRCSPIGHRAAEQWWTSQVGVVDVLENPEHAYHPVIAVRPGAATDFRIRRTAQDGP